MSNRSYRRGYEDGRRDQAAADAGQRSPKPCYRLTDEEYERAVAEACALREEMHAINRRRAQAQAAKASVSLARVTGRTPNPDYVELAKEARF